jgi:cytochrome P450
MPAIRQAFEDLDQYVRAMVEDRRDQPGEDLLTDLIAAEEAGDRLSTDEMVMLAEAVLVGGTDTTRNQLALCMALLVEHPDQWRQLAEKPELAAGAVEECLRYLGVVRGTARIASEDIEYKDVVFPTGTLVFTSLGGGNYDPSVFPSPDDFDITRSGAGPQLTFGSGIHYCLGASLARAELQEALPVLAKRMPNLELDGDIEWKPETFGIWGPERLPLRFDRAS